MKILNFLILLIIALTIALGFYLYKLFTPKYPKIEPVDYDKFALSYEFDSNEGKR